MKKRILTLGIALAVVAAMVVPMSALATNQANQGASTFSPAIEIVSKHTDDAVDMIVFSPGAPGATISQPFNTTDWDPAVDPPPPDWQILSVTDSEPVVRLKNTSGGDLIVWLQISDWTNGVVVAEDYELVDTTDTTVNVVDDVLSANGLAAMFPTSVTIPAGGYKALYLEVVLTAVAGVQGGSQLTILGMVP